MKDFLANNPDKYEEVEKQIKENFFKLQEKRREIETSPKKAVDVSADGFDEDSFEDETLGED